MWWKNAERLSELEVRIQVDFENLDEGKQRLKLTILPHEHKQRPSTEMGFEVHKLGKPMKGGFIPVTDQNHMLVLWLYWTPEVFKQKDLVNRASRRLYDHFTSLMDRNEGWKATISSAFRGEGWIFSDYWTVE